jgi:3-oxoacyl-[acyl-carrier-protein] synthase II
MASLSVVITGAGLVCAVGDKPAGVHEALCGGRTGFGPSAILAEQAGKYRVAEIRDFAPRDYLGPRNLRPLDRTGQLAAVAAELALADAGWPVAERDRQEVGLVLGTTFCSVRTIGEFDRRAMRDGPEYASPLDFANTVINAAAGQVAIWHHLRGLNSTISTGAVSGLHAIGYASQMIRAGRATRLLAGGAEELCFESFLGFLRTNLLCGFGDTEWPRPFDKRRAGCILGEGAGFVMLEAQDAAAARGARVLGRVDGFGAAYDSREAMTHADGANALTFAIGRAFEPGGRDEIDAVMSSGSGHVMLDAREATAIRDALGPRASNVPVTSIKGHVGETQGAGGALQTILLLESLRTKKLPPIAGLEQPEASFGLDFVTGAPRAVNGRRALATAVAREGNACALVVSAPANGS